MDRNDKQLLYSKNTEIAKANLNNEVIKIINVLVITHFK